MSVAGAAIYRDMIILPVYVSRSFISGNALRRCMPGDNITMEVELQKHIAIEEGLRFAIREGGRTVGSGVVSEIIE